MCFWKKKMVTKYKTYKCEHTDKIRSALYFSTYWHIDLGNFLGHRRKETKEPCKLTPSSYIG